MNTLRQIVAAFCLLLAISVPGMAQATKARPSQQQAPAAKQTPPIPPQCEELPAGCAHVANGKVVKTYRILSCDKNNLLFEEKEGKFFITHDPKSVAPVKMEAMHLGGGWYTPIGDWSSVSGRGNAEESSPGTIVLTIPIAKGFAIELPGMELITLKSNSLPIPEHLAPVGKIVYIYKPAGDYLTCTIQDVNGKRVCQ